MRRTAVLLSLFAAATVGGTMPAAHADPFCVVVWTDGTVAPNTTVGPFCGAVPLDADNECSTTSGGVHPEVGVYSAYCFPDPIPV
jgi:hypothetical protein